MRQPLDHLRSRKKPVRKTVWIAGDSELADELSELESSLTRAQSSLEGMREDNPRREAALRLVGDLELELAAKKDVVRENSIKFVLQSMGSTKYDDLIAQYPPTDEQLKKFKDQGETNVLFNPDTYPIALIVACCVEPEMEKDEISEWLHDDTWNSFEIMSLFMAAMEVNQSRRIVNVGKD